METHKTIYANSKQKTKYPNNKPKKRDKYPLIIKDKNVRLRLKDTYIEIRKNGIVKIFGVLNIRALFIHKDIFLNISECYAISKYMPIFFINSNGEILARYKRV
jgi:hypothetical protein